MMNDRDQFRHLMGETSALPPDDPDRRDVERRVAEEETWAEQEWRDLLLENKCLHTELPKCNVPADLEERLLAVADNASRWPAAVRGGAALAAAAVLLVLLGIVIARRHTTASRLETVALLAINNHLNHLDDQDIRVSTTDRGELEGLLSRRVRFEVVVPDLGAEWRLVGGRECRLGTHEVAFSLWQGPGGGYSLFQFKTTNFGLPRELPQKLVHSTEPAAAQHTCGAWIWAEHSRGYVLVGDSDNELDRLPLGR